jgi:hypothetical protein
MMAVPLKRRQASSILHGVTFQKTVPLIFFIQTIRRKHKRNKPILSCRAGLENTNEVNPKETEFRSIGWINLSQGRIQLRVLVNVITNF